MTACTLGYAVTQAGARRVLYELGLESLTEATDMQLRHFCDGSHECITVQPQLFQHHRPVGPRKSLSDIGDFGEGYNDKASTSNIRWSTRINLKKLLQGEGDFIDSYEDSKEG